MVSRVFAARSSSSAVGLFKIGLAVLVRASGILDWVGAVDSWWKGCTFIGRCREIFSFGIAQAFLNLQSK